MKKLIVISSSGTFKDESKLIDALFDEGMELFHLRKPDHTIAQIITLVEKIKPIYHHRIVLPANILKALPSISKKAHFFEFLRTQTNAHDLNQLKENGYSLSTSIHDINAYNNLHVAFDYTFYSPVFDSISKQDYKAMDKGQLNVSEIKKDIKLIALGGVRESNCLAALDYGFDGVALLGAVWQNEAPVAAFKRIQNIIKQVGE